MATQPRAMAVVVPRDQTTDVFLSLISNPFQNELQEASIWSALGTSLGVTAFIFVLFCFLRPLNSVVYAPKLKIGNIDEKHAPPPVGKGFLAWWKPVSTAKEQVLCERLGVDAAVFLRFSRMCRNMFLVLAILGVGILIPVAVTQSLSSKDTSDATDDAFTKMNPMTLATGAYWAYVLVSYLFSIIICGFLWWNYRAVCRMRREYLTSEEYLQSLSSRTLMLADIPTALRSDQGIQKILDEVQPGATAMISIGRNVDHIPDLIERHREAVFELESILAKYLKNPNQIPPVRPHCKPYKHDARHTNQNQKVDAISYHEDYIERLETEIKEARQTVDQKTSMRYGFASYRRVETAHSIAFKARSKHQHPLGARLRLAPRPDDIVWKNLTVDAKTRRWRRLVNTFWIGLLTVLWIVPNILIAVFLTSLTNLGAVWPAFQTELTRNPKTWAVVQGVLSPAITSAFYYCLPIIFRKLSVRGGDLSKTSRDRHVIHQLFAFFVFNNLFVFSLFSSLWLVIAYVVRVMNENNSLTFTDALNSQNQWTTFMHGMCSTAPFWISWLLQRNLGAAVDFCQIVNLAWGSFARTFLNPTPRELKQNSTARPFDYASYCNYFLFYATVTLCFAPLMPVVLIVVAFYFTIDSIMKKYLLMYIFRTKHESGGAYWRVLFNRFLVAAFIFDVIVAATLAANVGGTPLIQMLGCMVPLPIMLIGFKFYCKKTFDASMKYYVQEYRAEDDPAPTGSLKRFGHPALYQKLPIVTVSKKSEAALRDLYKGRLDDEAGTSNYGEVYAMKRMSATKPGELVEPMIPFNFANGSDFGDDTSRPGSPSIYTLSVGTGRPSTPGSVMSEYRSPMQNMPAAGGTTYPQGYHAPSSLRSYTLVARAHSPAGSVGSDRDAAGLLHGAAPMSGGTPQGGFTRSPLGTPDPYANTYRSGEQQQPQRDYFRGGSLR